MRKIIIAVGLVLVLGACGVEDNVVDDTVETPEVVTEETPEVVTVEETILVDNEYVTTTLTDFTQEYDDLFEHDEYKVHLTIENKTDSTILVQTREFSADGFMIDDFVYFSEEIAGGKSVKATINIYDIENNDVVIENNMEFDLLIADSDSWEDLARESVTIEVGGSK